MNVISKIISLFSGDQYNEYTDLNTWRFRFIKILLVLGIFFMPVGIISSLPVYLSEKNYLIIIIDVTGWLLFVSRLFSKSKSYKFTAFVIFLVLYFMMTYFFIELGPSYARPAWLVFSVVIAALVFGNSGAALSTILNMIILILLYQLVGDENMAWEAIRADSLMKWIMFVVNTSAISLFSGVCVGFVVKRLNRSLKFERETRQKLSAEAERISAANAEYKKEIERRVLAEKELSIGEEKYRFLVENIPSVTWISDEQGRTTFISPNVERLYGFSSQEIYENGPGLWFGRIHPEDLNRVETSYRKLFADKQQFDVEYRVQRKDGSWIWVHDKAAQTVVKDGNKYAYGVFTDITEKRHAEEALRRSEEFYHDLIETTNTGFAVLDAEGRVVDANREYVRLTGHSTLDEIRGRRVLEWTADNEKAKNAESINQCLTDGYLKNFEIDFIHPGGRILTIEINSTVVEKGGRKQILSLCRDITDRRKEVEEREKWQDHVVQSQKMEAIGRLSGGIAHDFNNILTAIFGYCELAIREAENGSTIEKRLTEVLKAGDRAKGLVKQILTFSRNTDRELRPIMVKNVVNEVLKLIRASLPSTIEILQNIISESIIMADPVQIHQIVMNLCTNAGHAMKEGGLLVITLKDVELDSVSLKENPDAKPGNYIKLSVSDTGHGMTQEIVNRIFDPYFTTKNKGEGTGLGLSVVRGIVKSYNGIITLQTEPGKGSTFNIFIPVTEAKPAVTEDTTKQMPTGTERILFVDDEPTISGLGMHMLESLGYKVTAITSSTEALELFKNEPDKFDLVITDMTMPYMTGDILAAEIMQIRPDIPVILCTGFSSRMDEVKAKKLGIKAFVMKPFVLQDIAFSIRDALGKK